MMFISMSGGNVRWRGFLTPGYFGKGKSRHHYRIDGTDEVGREIPAEIRQADKGGWDIIIDGMVLGHEHLKVDAQREVESMLAPEIMAAEYRTGFRK